jgi:hypothetical protein
MALCASRVFAHDVGARADAGEMPGPPAKALVFVVETEGPVRVPKAAKFAPETHISGQGFWKFVARPELVPVPTEALPKLKEAHGTIIVDTAADVVYWGLQGVGWIGFSNRLRSSWIVRGDPVFAKGNLHGADLLPRRGKPPVIAVADNVLGQVYLTDATFQHAEILPAPDFPPYADKKLFHPTDVAFAGGNQLWITDGYGRAWFMPASVVPLTYGSNYFGGKTFSQTPHGITFDPHDGSLLLSARPEGQIRRFDPRRRDVVEVVGLPAGSTVCDVDLWGDYGLAPCLDGPNQSAGPIYVVNLKKRTLAAIIKPRDELGYGDAQHIHDAAWYSTGQGANRRVYVLFTNWNPGGIGALELVNPAD